VIASISGFRAAVSGFVHSAIWTSPIRIKGFSSIEDRRNLSEP